MTVDELRESLDRISAEGGGGATVLVCDDGGCVVPLAHVSCVRRDGAFLVDVEPGEADGVALAD